MNLDEQITHKQELLSIYRRNLRRLELEQAESEFNLGLVNQIESVSEVIFNLEKEIEGLENHRLKSFAQLERVPYPLKKYEEILSRFTSELSAFRPGHGYFAKGILLALSRSLNARQAYVVRLNSDPWIYLTESEEQTADRQSFFVKHIYLREWVKEAAGFQGLFVSRSWPGDETALVYPFDFDGRNVLIIENIPEDLSFDRAFEEILRIIMLDTDCLQTPVAPDLLELAIHNQLKARFGTVSDAIYDRQFFLFNQQLERMTVFYQPIIFLSPSTPSIHSWEALARDPETKRAPHHLFETAKNWGYQFQRQLDIYFLRESIRRYVYEETNPDTQRIRRKNTILPLSVNAFPGSLIQPQYEEAVRSIAREGRMPLNKLLIEISEKSQIPRIAGAPGHEHVIDSFRGYLSRFKDLGIEFCIDDFGVGFASSSRVVRMGPAVVKIDRDALVNSFGDFTMEFVIRLTQRMPGRIDVIVEGYDDESRFRLPDLYQLGVRYIQGFKYCPVLETIDDRLPKDIVNQIKSLLSSFL